MHPSKVTFTPNITNLPLFSWAAFRKAGTTELNNVYSVQFWLLMHKNKRIKKKRTFES